MPVSPKIRTASIIGFGYMGGSIALDLLDQGVQVSACDIGDTLAGLAGSERFREIEIAPTPAHAATADVVVLAAPIQVNLRILTDLVPHLVNTRLVIDVGSTKRTIVAAAKNLGIGDRFVGCHPLCGSALSGWNHSRPGMFRDRRVYVCPTAESMKAAAGTATTFWQSLGAIVEPMDPEEHDRLLALTSHLPQVVSTLLGLTLDSRSINRDKLGPGGAKMTELAQSSSGVWSPILQDNMDNVGEALDAFSERLGQLQAELRKKNEQEIIRIFDKAGDWAGSGERGD